MKTTEFDMYGIHLIERWVDVPLDFRHVDGRTIPFFSREYVRYADKPRLLYLQGGPGTLGMRPTAPSGWMDWALDHFRVIQIDQRGTGLSAPIDSRMLADFTDPQAAATYLSYFRQDSIVADCEALRAQLGAEPWTLVGQSFGGFCITAYLSLFPEGVCRAALTGGLPHLGYIDDIYERTYQQTAKRNAQLEAVYPGTAHNIRAVAEHILEHDETLPTGEILTTTRLRQTGLGLGTTTGFDRLHYLFEDPFAGSAAHRRRLSPNFLWETADIISHAAAPLYALIHEPIYAGASCFSAGKATRWSADRLRAKIDGFAIDADPTGNNPYYLTGEHISREVFLADPALSGTVEIMDAMANQAEWSETYLPGVLQKNTVPVAAAVYVNDMFVPHELSLKTADHIAGIRLLETNEFQHDGIRTCSNMVEKLLQMSGWRA
ncbi:MAG: alpha/beta fold hydrolase [Actinomycetaceae bacterium]|nr:alpha/beta fold hydrolase [Actinomycetaceae bacterium]